MHISEDDYAAYAWLILFVGVNLYWITFDLWARATHHKMMTTQMRIWIADHTIGTFIIGAMAFIVAACFWHFVVQKNPSIHG